MAAMKIVDLFSGLNGWTQAFEDKGYEIISVDSNVHMPATIHRDVRRLTPDDFPWRPDIVFASPPCTRFTVANGWRYVNSPLFDEAVENVLHTVELIEAWKPEWFIIENPVGKLRKLDIIPYERFTTTLCRYGAGRMKPTDFWGVLPPGFKFRPPCNNGDWCHQAAPRGSHEGTNSLNYNEAAKMPWLLSYQLERAASNYYRTKSSESRPS